MCSVNNMMVSLRQQNASVERLVSHLKVILTTQHRMSLDLMDRGADSAFSAYLRDYDLKLETNTGKQPASELNH